LILEVTKVTLTKGQAWLSLAKDDSYVGTFHIRSDGDQYATAKTVEVK
jgi:hypothetical protein